MIFVTAGSKKYPFDRLFKELDELHKSGALCKPMFTRIGISTYQPEYYESRDFTPPKEFIKKVSEADIVISYGIFDSIMKVPNAGKKIVAVARLEEYRGHVNDRQTQNSETFNDNGYVLMTGSGLNDLSECFRRVYDGTGGVKPRENRDPVAVVNAIDKFIQEN